jgi:hypothetical protein
VKKVETNLFARGTEKRINSSGNFNSCLIENMTSEPVLQLLLLLVALDIPAYNSRFSITMKDHIE